MGLRGIRREVVAKHETAFLRGMGVEVDVDIKVLQIVGIVEDGFFYGPDGRVVKLVRVKGWLELLDWGSDRIC